MSRYFLLLACLALQPCQGTEHEELVLRALEAVNSDYQDTWAFTETTVADNTTYVATYDPRRPRVARWMLVSVDARTPSDDERASFLKEKAKADEKHSADSESAESESAEDERGLAATIQPGSLTLIEETADDWLFGFVPAPDAGDEDFMQHVDGRLRIVKDGEYLESLSLENTSPFKPALGVKISRFETRLGFGPAGDAGPIVPLAVDAYVKGRAFLAVRFDERENIRYSGYEYAGNRQEMVPDR